MEKQAEGQLGKIIFVLVTLVGFAGIHPVLMSRPMMAPGGIRITTATLFVGVLYLSVDTLAETVGKAWSKRVILAATGTMVFTIGVTQLVAIVPPAPGFAHENAFQAIFQEHTSRVVVNMPILAAGQYLNMVLFLAIKKATNGRWLFVRNILSTLIASAITSAIAVTVLFHGTGIDLVAVWTGMYIGRIAISLIDTPAVYVLVALWNRF